MKNLAKPLKLQKHNLLFIFVLANIMSFINPSKAWSSHLKKSWHPLFSLAVGSSSSSHLGKAQNFPIQNVLRDEFFNYTVNTTSQTSILLDLFLGTEWRVNPEWKVQAGIDFNTFFSPFEVNGTLTQGADFQSADYYVYSYQVLSKQLLLEDKLLYTFKDYYHPYLCGGLGAAFNYAYNFHTSVPPFLTFTRMYLDNTNLAFSYRIGLGIDVDINTQMRAGLGYRYANLGKIQLGNAFIDATPVYGTLAFSPVHTHQLLVQLTWIFN